MDRFTQEHFEEHSRQHGPLLVLDDVLSLHVGKTPSPTLFAYPGKQKDGYFETFTAAQLDGFVNTTVRRLLDAGFQPKLGRVVGLLGNPNLDWVVHLFALSRLGYCVVMMTLVHKSAILSSLLSSAGADAVIHDAASPLAVDVRDGLSSVTTTTPFVPRVEYEQPTPAVERFFSRAEQTKTMALVFSTSGSTGTPKPIPYYHANIGLSIYTSTVPDGGQSSILSWPLYHGWGLTILIGTMYAGQTCYVMDLAETKKVTKESFIEALEAAKPGFIPAPPFNLDLIARDPRALAILRAAAYVNVSGARLPDELGNYLAAQGVNISTSMGSSEATRNFATSMFRGPGDPEWDAVAFPPVLRSHVHLDPVPDNAPLHEIVFLPSFPGLSGKTNSDRPVPGCLRTGDIMRPHATKQDTWTFVCRDDDFIVLSSALNVLGLPIEDCVQQSPLVEAAVVVGVDRPWPGLLVKPADETMPREAFLEAIWPWVQEANATAGNHLEFTKARVYVLPPTTTLPRTDKGNVMRRKAYQQFATEIDSLYN